MNRTYICIDLKSFYASVECVERGLDALTTNLVVADLSRTEKTICLAVSPSLKSYGISGRARLFEVVQKVREINRNKKGSKKSFNDIELKNNPNLLLDYIVAPPRMKLYIDYSTKIYNIYLKYFSVQDILVYSIDEVFCDVTNYLKYYNKSPEDLVKTIIKDVYDSTGITATAGIGTNMYLAKVAMDIVAKHMDANEYGVRLASLDEMKYRELLWNHTPLTSFWRVGKGYQKKLEEYNMYTMGDIARMSLTNEDLLFKLLGVNAEILIDHAWGYEPCTMSDAKSYHAQNNSISSGQVLHSPYSYDLALLIVKEMTDLLVLDLVSKHLVTNKIVLTIGYDTESLTKDYDGEITKDYYGRNIPKHAHGTINIDHLTSSTKVIMEHVIKLYKNIVNDKLLVRRINVVFCDVVREDKQSENVVKQLDLFTDLKDEEKKKDMQEKTEKEERKVQKAIIDIQNKYGKNAILKGMNYEKGATGRERNTLVGGHKE